MFRDFAAGQVVRTADGQKLGKIVRVEGATFVIEKGIFFPKEYVARFEDVSDVRNGEIYLAKNQSEFGNLGAERAGARSDWGRDAGTDEQRIQVSEEQLEASKRTEEVGRVRVRKDVVTEQQQITVPVVHEEVTVERVPAANMQPSSETASFRDENIDIPVREEVVEIHKRPVVKEEIRVSKRQHVEQRAATEDVRKERVDIDEEGTLNKRDYPLDSDKDKYNF